MTRQSYARSAECRAEACVLRPEPQHVLASAVPADPEDTWRRRRSRARASGKPPPRHRGARRCVGAEARARQRSRCAPAQDSGREAAGGRAGHVRESAVRPRDRRRAPRSRPRPARSRPRRRGARQAHDLPGRVPLVGRHEAGRRHRPVHARARRLPRVAARSTSNTPTAASSSTGRRRSSRSSRATTAGWSATKPVVLIEFDFERDTIYRLGMPDAHRHDLSTRRAGASGRRAGAMKRSARASVRAPCALPPRDCAAARWSSAMRSTGGRRRSLPRPRARTLPRSPATAGCVPLSLRTNCRAEARISSSVAGGAKFASVLIFRHMGSSGPPPVPVNDRSKPRSTQAAPFAGDLRHRRLQLHRAGDLVGFLTAAPDRFHRAGRRARAWRAA